jgi:hypothetical protein
MTKSGKAKYQMLAGIWRRQRSRTTTLEIFRNFLVRLTNIYPIEPLISVLGIYSFVSENIGLRNTCKRI